ncbi:MAG: hypothetical protein AAFP77_29415 [Bacteroidota bacterium]
MPNSFTSDIPLGDYVFGEDGFKTKVNVATDLPTALYLGLAIFVGITLALVIYAKLLR